LGRLAPGHGGCELLVARRCNAPRRAPAALPQVHALQLAPPTPLQEVLPLVQQAAVSLVAVGGAEPVLQALQRARSAAGYSRWGAPSAALPRRPRLPSASAAAAAGAAGG
jgi:hypothetical protein